MSLKTFSGTTIPALLARVQQELGDEAVIVSTRSIRQEDGSTAFEILADESCREPVPPQSGDEPELVPTSEDGVPQSSLDGRPLRIALFGPTGTGKTTTLAKLAGHPRIYGDQAVGVLSLDTYRVGAVEQLRTYADLLGVPIEVVYETKDIDSALHRFGDRDVLLIDTPGRGPRNRSDRDAVDECLRYLRPHEIHLVLPVGMDRETGDWNIRQYRSRGATHLLATKLDEMPAHRTLFELAVEHDMPMRWITNGQEVPGDIRTAGSRLLSSLSGVYEMQPAES